MRKILLTILFVSISLVMINADDFKKPDFAYPVNVVKDASGLIEKGLRSKNYPVLIRGIINYQIAQSSIDKDSTLKSICFIDSILDEIDSDAPKALIDVLLAKIYSSIYMSNRWNYDSRQLPEDSIPEDFSLWDGKMFQNKIISLLDDALTAKSELEKIPLNAYKDILDITEASKPFFPVMYNFVAGQAIDIMRTFVKYDSYFPLEYLCDFNRFRNISFAYQPEVKKKILNLYKELLEYHAGDTAPVVYWNIERLRFTEEYTYSVNQHDLVTDRLRNALFELYSSNKSSEYSCEILIALEHCADSDTKYYSECLKQAMKDYPSYVRINCVRNILSRLTNPQIEISYNSTVVPGDTLFINISNRNADKFDIYVYKVPYSWTSNNSFNFKRDGGKATLVKKLHVACEDVKPFDVKQKETLVLNSLGCYIIVPSLKGKPTSGHYQLLHCTDTYISTGTYGNDKWAYLTNPLTGKPVDAGATVIMTRSNGVKVNSYKVDIDGTTILGNKGDFIFAENGSDRYAQYAFAPGSYIPDSTLRYVAHLVTDLAVYHPGDTVKWSAVIQSYLFKDACVADRMKLKVTLIDANNQEKDSSVCVSDDYGRIFGSFLLPKDGLTGNYSLKVESVANAHRGLQYGRCHFMVSDYKLPTYEVVFTKVLRNEPENGGVVLRGKVESYSGFPLAYCSGNFSVASYPKRWSRYTGNAVTFYTDSLSSDGNGEFEIILPAQLLAQAPVVNGDYNVSINFVSSSGESQSADQSFSLGKPYELSVSIKKNIDASCHFSPVVNLTDPMGDKVNIPMLCNITKCDSEEVLKTMEFMSSNPKMELTGIPSGLYDFEFVPADSQLADSAVVKSVYLYHRDDKVLYGLESDLWIPVSEFIVDSNNYAGILIGTSNSEIWVHYTITGDNRFISQGWKKFNRGVSRWNYNMPDGYDKVNIQLFSIVNYNTVSYDITVTDRNSLKKIVVGIENFRDKIIPGTKETWTFTLRDIDGRNSSGALMLDMYCKALDQLAPHPFSLSPRFGGLKFFRWGSYGMKDAVNGYVSGDYSYLECVNLDTPQYRLWMRSLYDSGIRIRGMMKSKATYDSGSGDMVKEEESDEVFYAVAEHKAVYNSMAAPSLTGGVTADSDVVEEAEEDTSSQPDENSHFSYRSAESPLAFFIPNLTFADGKSSITFDVPNANTTWRLQAIAFTKNLQVSTLGVDAVASKPIMVQPNLPRFIRQGDNVVLLAEVMNNSDSVANIYTHVEIFNPLTQEVMQFVDSTVTVEQGRSSIVPINLSNIPECQMIGYRVRAKDGIFTDGEQSVIPVLPSVSDVVDTYPFYIPKDSTHFDMKLPKIDKNSSVSLQYCNNPAWYLVTALPGLVPDNQGTAISAVTSLYSALTAKTILDENPSIASAIRLWNENNENDSVLVSMLEKNTDLKTILLNSTPWVSQAKTQTRRMSNLVLLLDDANIRDVYDKAVKKLSVLQCTDGGWGWIEQSRNSSQWVTLKVLSLLGQLKYQNSLGADSRLDGMIDRALRYMDGCVAKMIEYDSKAVDMEYVFVRGMYDTPMSHPVNVLNLNTINDIKRRWKNYGIFDKAKSGIIMMRNKNKSIAKNMLESIRQFAITNPYKGMWWQEINDSYPSVSEYAVTSMVLDFLHMVEPASPDIEKIAQWLVLQKETTDWGDSYQSSQVLSSLFNNGWGIVSNDSLPAITIDKKLIEISTVDSLVGNVNENLSGMKLSGKTLSVNGSGKAPSWGAIFVKSQQVTSNIAQHSCQDLSISKTIYKKLDREDKIDWVESDTFKVGDEVQVNLTLKVNRNLDYVVIIDERAAGFEPVEQLPVPMVQDGVYFYRENRDTATNIFVDKLPKGTYRLSYNLKVNNAGEFTSGIASAQSQYAPAVSAHSGGESIKILPM